MIAAIYEEETVPKITLTSHQIRSVSFPCICWDEIGGSGTSYVSGQDLLYNHYPIIRISRPKKADDADLFYKAGLISPEPGQKYLLLSDLDRYGSDNDKQVRPTQVMAKHFWNTHNRFFDWMDPECPLHRRSVELHGKYDRTEWECDLPMSAELRTTRIFLNLSKIADEFWCNCCHHRGADGHLPSGSGDPLFNRTDLSQTVLNMLGEQPFPLDLRELGNKSRISSMDYSLISDRIIFADSKNVPDVVTYAADRFKIWEHVLDAYGISLQISSRDLTDERKAETIQKVRSVADITGISAMINLLEKGVPVEDILR